MTQTYLIYPIPQRFLRYGSTDLCPLEGDHPVLQFINTRRNGDSGIMKDHLKNYEDLLCWSYEVGLVDWETHLVLDMECNCYIREAASIVQKTALVRGMLHDILISLLNGAPVHQRDLKEFNELSAEAGSHLRFELTDNGFEEVWFNVHEELAFPLWRMIKLAEHLFSSGTLKFIKQCKCGSYFIDSTKNKKRVYCNPLTCGSSARSMKCYQRKWVVGWS